MTRKHRTQISSASFLTAVFPAVAGSRLKQKRFKNGLHASEYVGNRVGSLLLRVCKPHPHVRLNGQTQHTLPNYFLRLLFFHFIAMFLTHAIFLLPSLLLLLINLLTGGCAPASLTWKQTLLTARGPWPLKHSSGRFRQRSRPRAALLMQMCRHV